ncbi:hypothetical protein DERF_002468 [Dermatophagoides farinae]|uniref:Uncharacterized protein n=1 Tax=Dermatophagoides farinae TaxID=6954 RepID=A0A922ID54_DERFA|nr:hypothetical protein DERF_002468 [Dermatophagoides farinae]
MNGVSVLTKKENKVLKNKMLINDKIIPMDNEKTPSERQKNINGDEIVMEESSPNDHLKCQHEQQQQQNENDHCDK